MAIPVSCLDDATIDYLRNAERRSLSSQPGVFVPRTGSLFVGPRSGWLLLTILGIGLLATACYWTAESMQHARGELRQRAVTTALLGSVGLFLLVTGVVRGRRKEEPSVLGNFLYADSAQLWIVQDGEAAALEYTDRLSVEGVHWSENGNYTHTQVTVHGLGYRREWRFTSRWLAERFVGFLQLMGTLRRSEDPTYQMLVALRSPHLGRLAQMIIDGSSAESMRELPAPLDPPRLQAARDPAPSVGWRGAFLRVASLGLLGTGLASGLPVVFEELRESRLYDRAAKEAAGSVAAADEYLAEFPADHRAQEVRDGRDDRLFAAIRTPVTGDSSELIPINRYLQAYPEGRHSTEARHLREDSYYAAARRECETSSVTSCIDDYLREYPAGQYTATVRAMRDDQLFAAAKRTSTRDRSTTQLRKYLAEKDNLRHREEAMKLISGFYESTIADLKARTEVPQKVVSATNGGVALLQGMKRTFVGRSFLPLAERAASTALIERAKVDDNLVQAMIGLVDSLKTADDPVLTVAFVPEIESEPTTLAGQEGEADRYAFHLRGRYADELKAIELRSPRQTALVAHASTFDSYYIRQRENMIFSRLDEAIRTGIQADILTLRQARPGEKANIEVRYRIYPAGFVVPFREVDDQGNQKRMIGLVREYYIDWTINFRPHGSEKSTNYTAKTRPGPNLLYYPESGDPDWAIYAVSLYSAFYDLSEKMLWGFGQNPGKAPSAFTFAGIGSQREDRPSRPINTVPPRKRNSYP